VSVQTTPEAVIAQAIERAGLDDFGADGWQEGLARSLDGFGRIPMIAPARTAAIGKLVHDLTMRLRIEQWHKENPHAAAQPVERPVFVLGLPRTGTTAMVGMLALDERFRFLRAWEGASPMPPPVAGEEGSDPRAIAAREAAAGSSHAHMHIVDSDGPEEDLAMLAGLDMRSYHGTLPMPDDYIDWWLNADFSSFYAFEERVLRLLHSRRPPYQWLLKSPPHLFRLREIERQYPDARFVMTHRDPVKVIASVASLHAFLHEERCEPGSVDRAKVGRRQLALWTEGMRRFLAVRAEIGEERFIDVRNDDVVRRPVETFERVYDHLGLALTGELRARLEAYNSRNAPGAFGSHRYTAEEFGLSDGMIRDAFGDYAERFGLVERAG
jgi:hypothetical protein